INHIRPPVFYPQGPVQCHAIDGRMRHLISKREEWPHGRVSMENLSASESMGRPVLATTSPFDIRIKGGEQVVSSFVYMHFGRPDCSSDPVVVWCNEYSMWTFPLLEVLAGVSHHARFGASR